MRKIFWQINVTLDGFMEGPDHGLEHTAEIADKDFERYASEMLRSIEAFIIGRKTYEMFAGYWPQQTGADADILNGLPKYVASRTLKSVEWNNARLIPGDLFAGIDELKREDGRDIAVFGSSQLASALIELGLVDELRIFITPYLLGSGTPAFKPAHETKNLDLVKSERWSSGTLALTYNMAANET
jgi:dihydrofolate reductase